jgi:hypothetical protein
LLRGIGAQFAAVGDIVHQDLEVDIDEHGRIAWESPLVAMEGDQIIPDIAPQDPQRRVWYLNFEFRWMENSLLFDGDHFEFKKPEESTAATGTAYTRNVTENSQS